MDNEDVSMQMKSVKSTSLILTLLALWFFTHPYRGIYHDASLYAVQALCRLFPGAYNKDLIFHYGSQDSYTIFGYIYANAIKLLGLNIAAIVMQIAGHLLWLFSAYILGRSLLKDSPVFWTFLAFAGVLSSRYGAGMFSYEEPFLTARIYSEPTVLLGIACLVNRRDITACMFLTIAAFLHPLMAAGGIMFALIHKAYDERKWLLLPIPILLLIYLAAHFHIHPFTGLIEIMDDEWYQLTHSISSHAFLDAWGPEHASGVLFDACILGSAFLAATGNLRRFFFTSLMTGFAGIFLTNVGTHVYRNVFMIQVQPWRALWLMHLFAYLAGAFLIFEFWRQSRFTRVLLSLYLIAWLMLPLIQFSGILAVLIFLTHLYCNKSEVELTVSWVFERLIFFTLLAIAVIWFIHWLLFAYLVSQKTAGGMSPVRFIQELLLDTKIFLILMFLYFKSLLDKTKSTKFVGALLLISLLFTVVTLSMWDQRLSMNKSIECNAMNGGLFNTKISPGSVISWPEYSWNGSSINKIWLMIGTSSYADPMQAVGIMFSREMATKYYQRTKRLELLGYFDPTSNAGRTNETISKPAFSELVHVCSDPELDYVVLSFKYPYGIISSYYDEFYNIRYYLYDCRLLRSIFNNEKRDVRVTQPKAC